MPTRPRDRRIHVQIRPWKPASQGLGLAEPFAGARKARGIAPPEHREVTIVIDTESTRPVRFFVSFDPDERHVVVQSVQFWPGPSPSAADFRFPFGAYRRIVQRAIEQADDGARRYELRGGKILDLDEDVFLVGEAAEASRRRPRREASDPTARREQLEAAAQAYRSNPQAPTQAVERKLHVSWRTAARRVAEARDAGLLPPVGGG